MFGYCRFVLLVFLFMFFLDAAVVFGTVYFFLA